MGEPSLLVLPLRERWIVVEGLEDYCEPTSKPEVTAASSKTLLSGVPYRATRDKC